LPAAWENRIGIGEEARALNLFALRHKHRQTFAGAAGLEEFAHRQGMTDVAAVVESRDQFGGAFGQNDVAAEHDGVAGKMDRFFFGHVNQIAQMLANRALAVFIECLREPERAAIGQRAEAGIDVIEARIDKLDRNDKTSEQVRDGPMLIDVGSEFVAAE